MTITINDNIPELSGRNALPFIERWSTFCPHCKIAQTNIWKLRKLSEEFIKPYIKFVWDYINNNDLKMFTKKQLMDGLDINHISDGVKQEKALSVLIMLGYLRKEPQVFLDKKGDEKTQNIYIKKSNKSYPTCYNTDKDRHIEMDWFGKGERKKYNSGDEK